MREAGRKAPVKAPAKALVRAAGKRRADLAVADPAAAREAATRRPERSSGP